MHNKQEKKKLHELITCKLIDVGKNKTIKKPKICRINVFVIFVRRGSPMTLKQESLSREDPLFSL